MFQLGLSVDANDNTIFGLHNGNNFTSVSGSVEGVGYHLYEIVYDPATQTIDLFVDGDELISDFAGRNFANLRQVLFGANSGGGTGTGYYNMVEFVVLPEPGGIVLLLSLLLPVLSLRPRRRPQRPCSLVDNYQLTTTNYQLATSNYQLATSN